MAEFDLMSTTTPCPTATMCTTQFHSYLGEKERKTGEKNTIWNSSVHKRHKTSSSLQGEFSHHIISISGQTVVLVVVVVVAVKKLGPCITYLWRNGGRGSVGGWVAFTVFLSHIINEGSPESGVWEA